MSPDRGMVRAGRVLAFTAAALTLAAAAHRAAGGRVDPALLPVLVPLVAGLVDLAAARRRGPVALLALTGLVQLGAHLAFMAWGMPGLSRGATGTASMPGMDMAPVPGMDMTMDMSGAGGAHGHLTGADVAGRVASSGPHAPAWLPFDAMTAWHVLAAVALALLLARGESAVWALAAHLAWTFRLPDPAPHPVPLGARPAPVVPVLPNLSGRPFLRVLCRRGPPADLRAARPAT